MCAFDTNDRCIGYYFSSPNEVTYRKLDAFALHGIVPSEQLMEELKRRIVPEAKVAIVAIARKENNYINHWIEYHKNLGIEHFYIFDNSFDDEPRLDTAISEENNRDVVTVIPTYNRCAAQKDSYKQAYDAYGAEYDYMLFIDIDEFLTLQQHSTVQQYIRFLQKKCTDFHVVKINWEVYDDNNMVTRDISVPVTEAFTHLS